MDVFSIGVWRVRGCGVFLYGFIVSRLFAFAFIIVSKVLFF